MAKNMNAMVVCIPPYFQPEDFRNGSQIRDVSSLFNHFNLVLHRRELHRPEATELINNNVIYGVPYQICADPLFCLRTPDVL
jgi:hypothetical protein